ncbi:tRNA pseudouridine(55) synthase TruB [uncultured Victivallis sp.]|uniref:tRNA pseudouridine(55) synthase TruB n=1 Tax=uncultured Victivallis sp. TaxID=354118 RepID=UPI0025E29534|nr:tRNA pseudouridine(55) synthase TruB [uncultured Victivallis sp.]
MRYNPSRHRLPVFQTSGVLLVDKPQEWTSFDVVNFVRARFNVPKVGHCGTLDPAATGLLVLVLGKFTQLSSKFSGEDKVYEAKLQLGLETDSCDLDGEVTATHDWSAVTPELLRETLAGFVGEQMQTPPMVSAVKKDGRKLYELARKGVEVEREAKPITIFSIDVTKLELPFCEFTLHCSKGTYVRTLCSDVGRKLGCGGTLAALRRTVSGQFNIADAVTIDQLKSFEQADLEIHIRKFLFERLSKIAGVNHG